MNEVYLGAFRRDSEDLPELLFPERLQMQTRIEELDESSSSERAAAGLGWKRYPGLEAANKGLLGQHSVVLHPRACHLLALGADALERGAVVNPQDLLPAYLRSKVAQVPASG